MKTEAAVGAQALPRFMYWSKGACRVEVLRRGHYPSTVKVRLENGVETEVELEDLKDVG